MDNTPTLINQSLNKYDYVIKGIDSLGKCGSDICSCASSAFGAVGQIGTAAIEATAGIVNNSVSTIGNAIDSVINTYKSVKLQKLQNELREIEAKHEERLQEMQYKHEEKMYEMQIKHEEFIISEQRKIIEKVIESANAVYNSKVEFLNSQLNSLEQMYSKQEELIQEDIRFLENERRKCINDATQYALITHDIQDLRKQKSKLYNKYVEAQGNLTTAIQILDINKSFDSVIGNPQINLLGVTK